MTTEQKKSFGKRVKHLMIDEEVTTSQIANAANVSDSMISKVIAGEKNPTVDILKAMSGLLHVSVDQLIADQHPND